MKTQSIKIVRGDDNNVANYRLKVLGDYTGNTVKLTVKNTTSLLDDRYVDLTVTSTFDNIWTWFSGTILKADTQSLSFDSMVWDLVSDEEETLYSGKVDFVHDVRSPSDGSALVNAYKYLRVSLTDGVATEEKSVGFAGLITYAFSAGTLTITSDTSGDFSNDIFININQLDCNYSYESTTELTVTPNSGYGTLIVIISKDA